MDAILPFVALLACPLMMIWCMRSMRNHGKSGAGDGNVSDVVLKEELAELREEVAMLRAQSFLEKR